uniref:Uncharacterized protein n=1 Tax=Anguilla anguilla TaxID=7936 RepID=A0A0E9WBD8_ANGAN
MTLTCGVCVCARVCVAVHTIWWLEHRSHSVGEHLSLKPLPDSQPSQRNSLFLVCTV